MSDVLSAATSIPLHCNICPKKPDFSDVSHLLTHVASKSHLSNYYRMKVKGSTDNVSKKTVDDYDEWYDSWNVQDLMRERMSQKEKKRGVSGSDGFSGSRRGSAAPSTASASARSTPMAMTMAGRRPQQRLRESMLDPQLDRRVKMEPASRSATPASALGFDPAAFNRSYAPPMQNWPTTPYGNSPSIRDPLESLYSTPTSDSLEIEVLRHSNRSNKGRKRNGCHISCLNDDDFEVDTLNDNTKLKGVYWEGMGMFDSATPQMRRKRNQKKAISVVQSLKATSEIVEPKELVFDTEGVLRRERTITGNPDDSDEDGPLKGESTPEPSYAPKKKTSRRPRQPLAEKHVNTNRALRGYGDSHHPPFDSSNKKRPYFGGADGVDDELTYGRSRPKRRTGLSIHRDNSGPEITFDHPAPLHTLTSAFCNPFQTESLQHQGQTYPDSYMSRGHQHQRQTSFPFGAGFRPASNHSNGIQASSLGSFGQLNGNSMFQNANFQHNPFSTSNGHVAFTTSQQQFGIGQPHYPFSQANSLFQTQAHNHAQSHQAQLHNTWDILGFGNHDYGASNNAGTAFHAGMDFTGLNPLFFSSTQPGPEDDEATISAPASDH